MNQVDQIQLKCTHCGKVCDETVCVKDDKDTFCCDNCCGEHKAKKEQGEEKPKSPNVCKFC